MTTNALSVRLMLVDDHPLVRDGLRMRLESDTRFRVVGEAGSIAEALLVAARESPDLALLDIGLGGPGGGNGIELACRLAEAHPHMAMLMLSMYNSEEYVVQALRAGARGYILKDTPAAEIIQAIEQVSRGGMFLSRELMPAMQRMGRTATLSDREKQVLGCIVDGLSNKEIARQLDLSVRTVETHRLNIKRKLGAESSADLVKQALKMGLGRL